MIYVIKIMFHLRVRVRVRMRVSGSEVASPMKV
jgi:hypothetical protein